MTRSLRILVIEDNQGDAALLEMALRRAGYDPAIERVQTAMDLQAALDREQWDVILSDYRMPNFTGTEALAILKERGLDIPFILVSGTIGEEQAAMTIKAGANDYLLKDNLSRLGLAVDRELREAAARQKYRRAQDALRISEQRYSTMFHRSPAGVYRTTLEGRILECNMAFLRIYGFTSREQALAMNAADLYSAPEARAAFLSRLRAEGVLTNAEVEMRRRDGTPVWVLETATLVVGDSGDPESIDGAVVDVTDRKQLEEQLRQSQKMDALGRLASGVAHDFNNLLSVIMAYAERSLRHLRQEDPLLKGAQEILKASERAAALTRQLLAFSRKQIVQPRVLDLNSVVSEMDKMLRRLIGADIEFVTLLGRDLGHIKADPGQLEQVLLNLVVNARDAMPQGGRLIVETRNVDLGEDHAAIHFEVNPGRQVLLAVSDSGIGMDAEIQGRIFEPFFTTKEPGKGTGLGLATVYGIVKQSGGAIWVSSEPGLGATFKVYFPRTDEAADAPSRGSTLTAPNGTETILLVEDEAALREAVAANLGELGYTVLTASNGEEALRRFTSQPDERVDLVITDMVMPQMSGRELVHRLSAVRPAVRVLYISGRTDEAAMPPGVVGPAIDFLEKPFTGVALARRIRQLLDRPRS